MNFLNFSKQLGIPLICYQYFSKCINTGQYQSILFKTPEWFWLVLTNFGIDPEYQCQIPSLDRKVLNINTIFSPSIVPSQMVMTVKTQMLTHSMLDECSSKVTSKMYQSRGIFNVSINTSLNRLQSVMVGR